MNLDFKLLSYGIIATLVLVALVFLTLALHFLAVWLRARSAGAPISMVELLALRLRGIPLRKIIGPYTKATQARLQNKDAPISLDDLASHHRAGGDVAQVIEAMLRQQRSGGAAPFADVCAWDLSTRSVPPSRGNRSPR